MSRYYDGPVSDHFDGERFFDPDGAPPRSRRDLLRWWRHRRARGKVAVLGAIALCRPPAGRASRARLGVFAMSAMQASSSKPPAAISCSTRYGRSAPRHFVLSGRSGSTIRASPLPTCRRSIPCWSRTAIMIIWMSLRYRGLRLRIARASSRRWATTRSCATTIPPSPPKATIGGKGSISVRDWR